MNDEFVIWGGYGGHNLGDEAILWSMSRLLRKLAPGAAQSVLVRNEVTGAVAEQYQRWDITPVRLGSWSSFKLLRRARLIVGGGQLLDNTLSAWPVLWTSLVLMLNVNSAQRALTLCIGAEPVKRKMTASVANLCYSRVQVCSCRDPESVEVAKSFGMLAKKVVATRDVVFSLDRDLLPRREPGSGKVPRIALVVAHDRQRTPGKGEFFSELAAEIAASGCEVSLIAHDLRVEYDYGLLLRIAEELKNNPRVIPCKTMLVEDVLQAYSNADAVVSGRMHPLILASLVRSLPIAIPGTAKVKSLVRELGLPALDQQGHADNRAAGILSFLSKKESYLQAIDSRIADFASIVETTTAQALIG